MAITNILLHFQLSWLPTECKIFHWQFDTKIISKQIKVLFFKLPIVSHKTLAEASYKHKFSLYRPTK